jgi:hypothetical protein
MDVNEKPVLPDSIPLPPVDGVDDGFTDDDDYVPVVVRKRERLLGTSSYVLLAALLVVGGFVGGAKWKAGRTSSTGTAAGTGNAAAAAFGGRGANGGGGFGARNGTGAAAAGGAGGATIGQVKLVDGTNVYVQDAQGNVVKVTTGPGTTINVTKAGAVADLKAGDTVVVQGAAGTDGTIAATSIGTGTGFGAAAGQQPGAATSTTTG